MAAFSETSLKTFDIDDDKSVALIFGRAKSLCQANPVTKFAVCHQNKRIWHCGLCVTFSPASTCQVTWTPRERLQDGRVNGAWRRGRNAVRQA
jgi:hypothetical protein